LEFRSAAARFIPATKTTLRRIVTLICSRTSRPPVAKQSTTPMSPSPSYLPHHSIPPIRSWPGPRIAWESVSERIAPAIRASRNGFDVVRRCTASGSQRDGAPGPTGIPPSAVILLHFDIDVFEMHAMPAAYFPHKQGLSLSEGAELIGALLKDPRIRIIEVSEYAALRDLDQSHVAKIVDLLANGLNKG
jgi:arginase